MAFSTRKTENRQDVLFCYKHTLNKPADHRGRRSGVLYNLPALICVADSSAGCRVDFTESPGSHGKESLHMQSDTIRFCRRSDLFLSKSVWKHLLKQSFKNSVAGITLWNILKRSHLWSSLENTGSSEGSCWQSLWQLTLQTDLLLPNSFAKWVVWTSPVCEGFFFRHCILNAILLLPTLKFFWWCPMSYRNSWE